MPESRRSISASAAQRKSIAKNKALEQEKEPWASSSESDGDAPRAAASPTVPAQRPWNRRFSPQVSSISEGASGRSEKPSPSPRPNPLLQGQLSHRSMSTAVSTSSLALSSPALSASSPEKARDWREQASEMSLRMSRLEQSMAAERAAGTPPPSGRKMPEPTGVGSSPRRPNPLLVSPGGGVTTPQVPSPLFLPSPAPSSPSRPRGHAAAPRPSAVAGSSRGALQPSPKEEKLARSRSSPAEGKRVPVSKTRSFTTDADSSCAATSNDEDCLVQERKMKKKKSIKAVSESPAPRRSQAPVSTLVLPAEKDRSFKKTHTLPASSPQSTMFQSPSEFFGALISPPAAQEPAPSPQRRRASSRPKAAVEASPQSSPPSRPSERAERRGSSAPRKSKKEKPKEREPRQSVAGLSERERKPGSPKELRSSAAWPAAEVVGRIVTDEPALAPWDAVDTQASAANVTSPTVRPKARARRWSPRSEPRSPGSPLIARAQEGQLATFGLDLDEPLSPDLQASPGKGRQGLLSPSKLGGGVVGDYCSHEDEHTFGREDDETWGRGQPLDTGRTEDSGFDVTFGRGGLECVSEHPADSIVDVKKTLKKGKHSFADVTTVTDHAVVVKPKGFKTLNDVAPGHDFDATKGLAAFGMLRAAADGKRGQKEALVRLPRVQEWSSETKDVQGKRRPSDWASAARELSQQSVLGTAARHVSRAAVCRWYGPYLFCVCVNFAAAAALVGRSEFLALQLPLLMLLLVAHLTRVGRWDRRLQEAVDRCARDEVKKQLNAPLGWGEGTQNFSANLPAALQAAMEQPGALLLPASKASRWRQPAIWAALPFALLTVMRLARLGMRPLGMWSNVWQSLEVIAAVGLVLLFVAVGCSHKQAGASRSLEANGRVEALEAAFNSMLDVLRPLLGPNAGPVDFGCSAGVHDLAANMMASKHNKSAHFSVRLINAEGQTLRTALVLDFGSAHSLSTACALAGFGFAFGAADGATATDLGGVGSLGLESALAATTGGAQATSSGGTSWASTLMGRLRNDRGRQQDDAVSVSISSQSTATTMRSKRDGVDELSLHLAANMLKTLCSRRTQPLEVFRAGHLGGCGVMPPKANVEEPCLILALSPDKLLWADPRPAGRKGVAGDRMPPDDLGVLRDAKELERLLHPERGPCGVSPRSSAASNGSVRTLSSGEGSGSPSFGVYGHGRNFQVKAEQPAVADQRNLAILFDTYAERDLCLSILRSIGFVPRLAEP